MNILDADCGEVNVIIKWYGKEPCDVFIKMILDNYIILRLCFSLIMFHVNEQVHEMCLTGSTG